ncbi:hypothetical protein Q3G72_023632 [Acer saccharum]|nr:hypothetical protein Q3G72_023632 [Acer saccharum]
MHTDEPFHYEALGVTILQRDSATIHGTNTTRQETAASPHTTPGSLGASRSGDPMDPSLQIDRPLRDVDKEYEVEVSLFKDFKTNHTELEELIVQKSQRAFLVVHNQTVEIIDTQFYPYMHTLWVGRFGDVEASELKDP